MSAISYNYGTFEINRFEGELKKYDLLDNVLAFISWLLKGLKRWTGIVGVVCLLLITSPLIALFLWFTTWVYKRLARKISGFKVEVLEEISKSSFEDLKGFEKVTDKLYKAVKKIRKDLASAKKVRILNGFCYASESIYNDLTEMREAAEKQYHFCMKDLFSTEEEYQQYCAELKSLGNIWNYEGSNTEKKVVFDLKKADGKSR